MKKIIFDINAIDDLKYWVKEDKKKAIKILELIDVSSKTPFKDIGKPEPLKYELQGCWSRRINQEQRLVYEVKKDYIRILACRYHY